MALDVPKLILQTSKVPLTTFPPYLLVHISYGWSTPNKEKRKSTLLRSPNASLRRRLYLTVSIFSCWLWFCRLWMRFRISLLMVPDKEKAIMSFASGSLHMWKCLVQFFWSLAAIPALSCDQDNLGLWKSLQRNEKFWESTQYIGAKEYWVRVINLSSSSKQHMVSYWLLLHTFYINIAAQSTFWKSRTMIKKKNPFTELHGHKPHDQTIFNYDNCLGDRCTIQMT